MLLNDNLKQEIKFVHHPAIESRTVHTTCERCTIMDCEERAAPPTIVQRRNKLNTIEAKLDELIDS